MPGTTSLIRRHHELAVIAHQLDVIKHDGGVEPFEQSLSRAGIDALRTDGIRVMQINVGKMCNQTCKHCHVDAGPDRTEIMTRETMELCLRALERLEIPIVDLTGGAPEMNPHFRWLVERVRALGRHVIDRCNLTILTLPKYAGLVEFLARHQVEVTASLPYYIGERTDAQRGEGVFERSIEALHQLNDAGYGQTDSGLLLNLVYNPVGAFLPPRQEAIEADYRRELMKRYGIVFNRVFTITNMPINRFLEYLIESGNYPSYMRRLHAAFNPDAARAVMCREMLSIGWDGDLYDCDFNQMLGLHCDHGAPKHIADFDPQRLQDRQIVTGQHCYGCTAGAGSSCGGALD